MKSFWNLRPHLHRASSGQGSLKPEGFSCSGQFLDPSQKQSSSSDILGLRCKRRQPRGNQVCIQELTAVHEVRQKFNGKGGFSRAVRPGNHVNRRIFRLTLLCLWSVFRILHSCHSCQWWFNLSAFLLRL